MALVRILIWFPLQPCGDFSSLSSVFECHYFDESSILSPLHADDVTGLLAARSQEADSNGDRARKLQRELDSTRRDAEGMLTVSLPPLSLTAEKQSDKELSGKNSV